MPTPEAPAEPAPVAEPAPTDPAAARSIFQPLLDDAIERIRIRFKQDQERGRNEEVTRTWADEHVLPPLIEAANRAGIEVAIKWSDITDVTPQRD